MLPTRDEFKFPKYPKVSVKTEIKRTFNSYRPKKIKFLSKFLESP